MECALCRTWLSLWARLTDACVPVAARCCRGILLGDSVDWRRDAGCRFHVKGFHDRATGTSVSDSTMELTSVSSDDTDGDCIISDPGLSCHVRSHRAPMLITESPLRTTSYDMAGSIHVGVVQLGTAVCSHQTKQPHTNCVGSRPGAPCRSQTSRASLLISVSQSEVIRARAADTPVAPRAECGWRACR